MSKRNKKQPCHSDELEKNTNEKVFKYCPTVKGLCIGTIVGNVLTVEK